MGHVCLGPLEGLPLAAKLLSLRNYCQLPKRRTILRATDSPACRLLDYNYFLSLPLATPATVRQFEAFRKGVLGDPKVCACVCVWEQGNTEGFGGRGG